VRALTCSQRAIQMLLLHIDNIKIALEKLGCAGPVIVFESGLGSDMSG